MSKIRAGVLLLAVAAIGAVLFLHDKSFPILQPSGDIAHQQRNLIIITTLVMLIIVVPVFVMLGLFVWKYREGAAKKARYTPEWDGNRLLETVWWGFPILIILGLGIITWNSSHDLDPFKPIEASAKPMRIQVIALDWKWLFIYPDQNVATVNYVPIPEDTPIDFEITSDAPMNSFWIPELGGQIYAMTGMSTHLHLIADKPGSYKGSSANLSGAGFAGMKFTAKATTRSDFDRWISNAQQSFSTLSYDEYQTLAKPSQNNPEATYKGDRSDIYALVMAKYMNSHSTSGQASEGHH